MTLAERKQRFKARRAAGLRVYRIAADEVALPEKLVAAGYLSPLVADQQERVEEALERVVADLALKA